MSTKCVIKNAVILSGSVGQVFNDNGEYYYVSANAWSSLPAQIVEVSDIVAIRGTGASSAFYQFSTKKEGYYIVGSNSTRPAFYGVNSALPDMNYSTNPVIIYCGIESPG